jgi:hypothetical protein
MPYASCSARFHPAPRPSSIRPPLIASTCATLMASGPGSRKVADVTSVPSRIVLVCTASAPSVTQESVGPGSPPPGWKLIQWSDRKNPSKPSSSACRATRS